MKLRSLVSLSLLTAGSLTAAVEFDFSLQLAADGPDEFGLAGSTWTFHVESDATQYEPVGPEGSEIPGFNLQTLSVSISGSSSWDGTYSLTPHYPMLAGFMSFGGTPLFAPHATTGTGLVFDLGELAQFTYGGAVIAADAIPAFGDTITAADLAFANPPTAFMGGDGFTVTQEATTTSNYTFSGVSSSANVAAVPEPTTYAALLGLGALGLVTLRRRK